MPDDAVIGMVVALLERRLVNPGGQLGTFTVLDLDDDRGNAGDVTAVLDGPGKPAFGVGKPVGAQVVDDGAFGAAALGFAATGDDDLLGSGGAGRTHGVQWC